MKRLCCAAALLILACGCSNYNELSDFDIVAGMAVDKADGEYALTLELLDLEGSLQPNEMKARTIEVSGPSIPKALDAAKTQFSKQLHFGNIQVVVIGQEPARTEGLYDLMDWFLRDVDIRETVRLVISQENTAAELLGVDGADFPVASYAIERIVNPGNQRNAHTKDMSLYCTINTLDTPGATLSLPAVRLREDDDKKHVEVSGLAVFKGDRLHEFMGPEHTPLFLYLVDKVSIHEFAFTVEDGVDATLYISSSKTRRSFHQTDQGIVFRLEVQAIAALDQATTGMDMLDKQSIASLEQTAAQQLREEILRTIEKTKEIGVDMAGLGNDIYLRDRQLWEECSSDWQGRSPDMEVALDVSVSLQSVGAVHRS